MRTFGIGAMARNMWSWLAPRLVGLASLCASLVLTMSATALAQGLPPQKDYFVGEGQVDLQRGTFLYSNTDIVVGAGPIAIPLTRIHNVSGGGAGPLGSNATHNLQVQLVVQKFIEEPAGPGMPSYRFHVVRGSSVDVFYQGYGSSTMFYEGGSGGYQKLTMSSWLGPYTYTGPDGEVIQFGTALFPNPGCFATGLPGPWCALATDISYPDGTKWTFGYDSSSRLRLVSSNRGMALGFNFATSPTTRITQVCAVNLAQSYASVTAPCPGGAPSIQYGYACISNGCKLTGFTDTAGQTTSYGYGGTGFEYGISTIKNPGEASPNVTINYYGSAGKVLSQVFANGATWTYDWEFDNEPWDITPQNQRTDVIGPDNSSVRYTTLGAGGSKPSKIRDQNNREWNYVYNWVNIGSVLERATDPEGNYTNYSYFGLSRQPTEIRKVAKPGSGLPDIVATATYTSPCTSNPKLCEKPLTKTDANGNTTTYTYDAVHGGVLTETGPAVGGVAPQKRYEYAQRYAWVKNSAGTGYVQATTPVWVLTRERYCRTTAASGASCAGGAADEVITDYDYGPNNGPNNLLVRGVAVTADGQTLRTCYGYDAQGRKISETKPAANPTSCS